MDNAYLRRVERMDRIQAASELLQVIAGCGRGFFNHTGRTWTGSNGETHEGHVSQFHTDARGRVYLENGYTGKACYRIPSFCRGGSLGWYGKKFTEGGTLNQLCQHLDDYIRTGRPQRMDLGPWPAWYCDGDLWGYGDDMDKVRTAARNLGVWDYEQPGC